MYIHFLAFLLFICFSFTSIYTSARNEEYNIKTFRTKREENVFNQLGMQTGLKFFYDQKLLMQLLVLPSKYQMFTGCFERITCRQNCISIGIIIQYLLVNRKSDKILRKI